MLKSLIGIEEHPIHKGYFISRDGKVYTNLRKITQKGVYPCPTSYEPDYTSEPRELALSGCNGYRTCSIRNKTRYVHRLVAETFILNPNNFPEVNHLNKNRRDNRVENLEWCDRQSNAEHGYAKSAKIQCIRTGEVFEVFNYTKWCRENDLNAGSLAHTRTGERKQHKGYKLLADYQIVGHPKCPNSMTTTQTKMTATYQANVLDISYNGWSNYETFNVALWINNDEGLYNLAMGAGDYETFVKEIGVGYSTPDGVKYADPKVNVVQLNSDVFDL